MIAAARADPGEAVMRPSSESSLSAPRSRRTSLSVTTPPPAARPESPLCEPGGIDPEHAERTMKAPTRMVVPRRETLCEVRMYDAVGSSESSRSERALNIGARTTNAIGECPQREPEGANLLRLSSGYLP